MTFQTVLPFTQQAVQHAIDKATGNGSQAVGAVHLLAGVLSRRRKRNPISLRQNGCQLERTLQSAVDNELRKAILRVSGSGQPYLDNDANEVLQTCKPSPKRKATLTWVWNPC